MLALLRDSRTEFAIRQLLLLFISTLSISLFGIVFPAIWLTFYFLSSFSARHVTSRLTEGPSLKKYIAVLVLLTLRMLVYRGFVIYLWFYPNPAAQIAALAMVMAAILFSVSQSTNLRSYAIIQGIGDAAALAVIAFDFLVLRGPEPGALLSGICILGVIVYHGTILRETHLNRLAALALESRIRQSQKLEAVGRLTGGVAHDFNNILTVVMGNLELFEEIDDPAERKELVRKANAAAKRASVLTAQLLAFSRQTPLQTSHVETAAFLRNILELTERVLPATITLELDTAPQIRALQVDRSQLEVAVLNLIINARDAMPKGGTLRLGAANFDPSPDDELTGHFVQLTLTDEGDGIPPEILHRVLDPFFTTKSVGKGSGLGLSMVSGFIDQSGGTMRLDSTVGVGTEITLLIPASVPERGAQ